MTIEERIAWLEKRLERLNLDLFDLTRNGINGRLRYYEIMSTAQQAISTRDQIICLSSHKGEQNG